MTAPFTKYVLNSLADETREFPSDIWVTESKTELASGPFTDPGFHLLVRDEATLLDVTHSGEECNFLRGVTVIDVIWKPVNRLEDLFFDAHD